MTRIATKYTASIAALVLMGSAGTALASDYRAESHGSVNAQLEAMDDNRDARITRAEAKDYYDSLYHKLAKTDGEPGISVEDLVEGPRKLAEKRENRMAKKARRDRERNFDATDYNRDDMIDRGEFLDGPHPHLRAENPKISDRELMRHFNRLDTNDDDMISHDEYMAAGTNHDDDDDRDYNRMEARAEIALNKMDRNNDGIVSRIEFTNAQWGRFADTDRNGDDALDRDEIRKSIRARGNTSGGFFSSFSGGRDYDRRHGSPTPLYSDADYGSDLDADLNAEMNTWRNPDER